MGRPTRTGLTTNERKTVFASLVALQDTQSVTIAESKYEVARRFRVTPEQVKLIETEGLEKEWPPLG